MLEIGNGAMTDTEYQTHMSQWAILAAPLLAGNDLRSMTPTITAILENREVIAVNQDKLGKQGERAWKSGDQEIWVRELSGGSKAVAVYNRGGDAAAVHATWADLKMKTPAGGRDVWLHKDVKFSGPDISANVASHGVVMWVVK
jgi:alpha-galactosidase